MKKLGLYIILAIACIGCQKKSLTVNELEFDVSVPQDTYYVGDVVTFDLTGTPEFISFYSGEIGNDYDSIGGRIMPSELYMSFYTQVQSGTQEDQFHVMVSTDFSGQYTVDGVNDATWTNITDQFTLATIADDHLPIESGVVNISDLNLDGVPMYFAFFYQHRPRSTYGVPNVWRFGDFLLEGRSNLGSVILAHQSSQAWVTDNFTIVLEGLWDNNGFDRVRTIANGRISFVPNTAGQGLGEVYNSGWVISKPYLIDPHVNLGPDRAVPIKALADADRTSYTHVYETPGTYKVTFVAANENLDERQEVVRQLEITILPRD